MAELKTQKNDGSVSDFLDSVDHERRREECRTIVDLMKEVTGEPPIMWGGSIIGFGQTHYEYESGREGDWFKVGVSPRKQNLTLYVPPFEGYDQLLAKLGKYKTGKVCLYINKLADVDFEILREIVSKSATKQK